MVKKIGILALQGNFQKHKLLLDQLGIKSIYVRYASDLDDVNGLIIPGGESTTMTKLLDYSGLFKPIISFAEKNPVLGTCAGLIMMSKSIRNNKYIKPLGILDIEVDRNAYGRQLNSFMDIIDIEIEDQIHQAEVLFIRAPKITKVGNSVNIISKYQNEIVAVRSGMHFGFTFHPELNEVTFLHHHIFKNKTKYHKENNAA